MDWLKHMKFHPPTEWNVRGALLIIACSGVLWTGLVEIMPMWLFKPVSIVLGAFQSALTFLMVGQKQAIPGKE